MELGTAVWWVIGNLHGFVLIWAIALVGQCVSELTSGKSLAEVRARLPWIVEFATIATFVLMFAFTLALWLDPDRVRVHR